MRPIRFCKMFPDVHWRLVQEGFALFCASWMGNRGRTGARGGRFVVPFGIGLLVGAWTCTVDRPSRTNAQEPSWNWTEITDQAGLEFRHTDGSSGRYYIVESMTSGIATFDYDGDGRVDIYLLNGAPLPGTPLPAETPTNKLYRNLGHGRFADVTERARVGDPGYSLGATVADFDNDGDLDLYVSNFGPNRCFMNNGDGTFTDATATTGTGGGDEFGAGVVFMDHDCDGDLDLFVGNYVEFSFDRHIVRMMKGYQFHPGPADYPPARDRFLENLGNGRFADVTDRVGIGALRGATMGALATDVDDDGDLDIVVANDSTENYLWRNENGVFTEEGLLAGLAFDRSGQANGNMGIDGGDVDGDGRIDLITTTFQDEMPVLYRNLGEGMFDDVTNSANLDRWLHPHVNWGCVMADFDLDSDTDLFIANGHFMDNLKYIDDRTDVRVPNRLMLNRGQGIFVPVVPPPDSVLAEAKSSRGAAAEDFDGDGDVDLLVANFNDTPTLIRNDLPGKREWIQVRLIGTTANRSGIGAKIEVRRGARSQVAELYAGRGYQSCYGVSRVTFGLDFDGPPELVIRVRWPCHGWQQYQVKHLNAEIVLIEGSDTAIPLAPGGND